MRKYATTLILASTLLIGEVHTFWEKGSQRKENWIISRYEPMTVQWNIKFVGDQLNVVLYFVAFLMYAKNLNRVNKTTVIVFLATAIIDIGIYFWNFKTINYHYVYFFMIIVWGLIYFLNPLNRSKK